MAAVTATESETGQRFASRRLYRLLSLSLSITTLLMLIALAPVVPDQVFVVGTGYSLLAIGVIGAPAVVALALFRTAPDPCFCAGSRACRRYGMLLLYFGDPLRP